MSASLHIAIVGPGNIGSTFAYQLASTGGHAVTVVARPGSNRLAQLRPPVCVAFEAIAVAGMRRGGGASWREAAVLARGVQACFALIESAGDPLYPAGKARLHACPSWVTAAILWSVSRVPSFRVLLAQGVHECRALADVMAEAARQAGRFGDVIKIAAMKPPGSLPLDWPHP